MCDPGIRTAGPSVGIPTFGDGDRLGGGFRLATEVGQPALACLGGEKGFEGVGFTHALGEGLLALTVMVEDGQAAGGSIGDITNEARDLWKPEVAGAGQPAVAG